MKNLLLEEDKKFLQREYFSRLLLVVLVFLFFTILAGNIFLLPSFFLSQIKEDVIKAQAEITKRSVAAREQEASATILFEAKRKVELLSVGSGFISLADVFETIVAARPAGVSLSGISFRERGEQENEITVSGTAARREGLLSFARTLEANELFETVDLPISNLASDQDIDFIIRVTSSF